MASWMRWLKRAIGDRPLEGVKGQPTPWFDVGVLGLPAGRISVSDLWACYPDPDLNVSVDVPAGAYAVAARRVAANRRHRMGGVRVTLTGSVAAGRGRLLGRVAIDSWVVVLGGVETWQDGVAEDAVETLCNSAPHVRRSPRRGCQLVTWTLARRRGRFAIAHTGTGAGVYPVFELIDPTNTRVGVEVDFFPDGGS